MLSCACFSTNYDSVFLLISIVPHIFLTFYVLCFIFLSFALLSCFASLIIDYGYSSNIQAVPLFVIHFFCYVIDGYSYPSIFYFISFITVYNRFIDKFRALFITLLSFYLETLALIVRPIDGLIVLCERLHMWLKEYVANDAYYYTTQMLISIKMSFFCSQDILVI